MYVEYKRIVEKEIPVAELRKGTELSTYTFIRLRRNQLSINVLLKIAEFLDCRIEDLCEFINEDKSEDKQ